MYGEIFKESDWKLLRKKIPQWQENFIAKLNAQYLEILSQKGKNPSEIFWKIEERINCDKEKSSVRWSPARSRMYETIANMLREGGITLVDLDDFSEELKAYFRAYLGERGRKK